ncbi:MAG: hypothetical protein WAW67_00800, partial [Candidatus Omnitrophota bacterium]
SFGIQSLGSQPSKGRPRRLVPLCEMSGQGKQDKDTQKSIAGLEQQKLRNKLAEEVALKVGSLPASDTYEKVIKYEKAVQRSILQNLALLKRLQSMR